MYTLKYAIDVDKTCKKYPRRDKEAIVVALEKLRDNPRPDGVVKLSGNREGYRLRVGDYRIIYRIQDKELIVLVIDIENRATVYKKRSNKMEIAASHIS